MQFSLRVALRAGGAGSSGTLLCWKLNQFLFMAGRSSLFCRSICLDLWTALRQLSESGAARWPLIPPKNNNTNNNNRHKTNVMNIKMQFMSQRHAVAESAVLGGILPTPVRSLYICRMFGVENVDRGRLRNWKTKPKI